MRDSNPDSFQLSQFLPYLLNQAAEASSLGFHAIYADEYALSRTQWRVIAHLGRFGALTASEICRASHIEKTKVSRAVAALEERGLIARRRDSADRRAETLRLTTSGRDIFDALGQRAREYDADLRAILGPERAMQLEAMLREIGALRA